MCKEYTPEQIDVDEGRFGQLILEGFTGEGEGEGEGESRSLVQEVAVKLGKLYIKEKARASSMHTQGLSNPAL